jgi:hypothetical protein
LIAVTSRSGPVPLDVFPVYLCPQCAAPHVPAELSQSEAIATVLHLLASLREHVS